MSLAVTGRGIVMEFASGDSVTRVLHDISLDIATGGLSMLIGPSGCGKTTLLSVLAGILSPTQGEVDVFGTRITRLKDKDKVRFRRENIGFIFQQYNLLTSLTAAENVAIPLVAAGMPLPQALLRANAQLAQVGMEAHTGKLPRQLSGGQQQRVAIARALVHQPRLIVCDEPTAALDAATGQGVMELLRTHGRADGRAVVVVTHDPRVYRYADHILQMEDGRIIRTTDDYRTLQEGTDA